MRSLSRGRWLSAQQAARVGLAQGAKERETVIQQLLTEIYGPQLPERPALKPDAGGQKAITPEPVEGPGPCDSCPHAERCRVHLLACAAFSAFVNELRNGGFWEHACRRPNRVTYVRMFSAREEPTSKPLSEGERTKHVAALPQTGRARLAVMAKTLMDRRT